MNRFTDWLWKQFTRDLHPSYKPSTLKSLYWLLSDLVWFGRSLALSGDGVVLNSPMFPTRSDSTQQHEKYTPVLNNPHFNHLTALLRVPFLSQNWRRKHPQIAFWTLEKDFRTTCQLLPASKTEVVSRFVDLLHALVVADPTLHYTTADMNWLIATVERPDSKTVLSLFCACYSSPTGQKDRKQDNAQLPTLSLYVKDCNNAPGGMPLTTFTLLSPVWTGEQITLPFGPESEKRVVVGWNDLFFGSPVAVSCTQVQAPDGSVGFLVYGGNQGVRIYQASYEDGYGQAIIWVEDAADLPDAVKETLFPAANTGEQEIPQ